MTGRERLLTAIQGGIPDRLPWTASMPDYFLSTLPDEINTDDPVNVCRYLGVDVTERWTKSYRGFRFDLEFLKDAKIKVIKKLKGDKTHTTFETPAGTLNSVTSKNMHAGDTTFYEEMLIKNKDDLRAYKYLWEAKSPYPFYEETRKRIDIIGEDGIAMAGIPCTPLLHLIMYDLGLEKLAYFLYDYPKEMDELLDIMSRKSIEAARIAAASPAKVGLIAENSGTLLVSPDQFERYCKPVIAEYAKFYKEKGKYLFLHACGHLKGLLKQIAEIDGLSGIESLTPPPTADADLDFARNTLRDDMTIIGGMDPVMFLNSTPEDIEKIVEKIIEKVSPGNNFVLMPADSTPANSPVENFKAVNEAIEKYGKWSK